MTNVKMSRVLFFQASSFNEDWHRQMIHAVAVAQKMGRKPITKIPRRGVGLVSRSCPLARALGPDTSVGGWTYDNFDRGIWGVHLPKTVERFVTNFDTGKYPWLEQK